MSAKKAGGVHALENGLQLIRELNDACDALLSIVESLDDDYDYAAVRMANAAMEKAEAVL